MPDSGVLYSENGNNHGSESSSVLAEGIIRNEGIPRCSADAEEGVCEGNMSEIVMCENNSEMKGIDHE